MASSLRYFLYRTFIDPLVAGIHREIVNSAAATGRIVDIGCGPGSLSMLLAARAADVTAIDIDEEMLIAARREAGRKGTGNISFLNMDATDLSVFKDAEFEVAVTSMTVHQFHESDSISILREMNRIARRVIVADYNYPMPAGFSEWISWGLEWLAGGDHYNNFRNFMGKGGLLYFLQEAGLRPDMKTVNRFGALVVYVMS